MDENEVVEAIAAYLKNQGYSVKQKLTTKQRGIDIKAEHPKKGQVLVEAKGGTSTFEKSARYGKPYTKSQVFDRVAKGIFTSARLKEEYINSDIIFAVPKTDWFVEYLSQIKNSISSLGLQVFLVKEVGSVEKMRLKPNKV
jgi:hypothetical protein